MLSILKRKRQLLQELKDLQEKKCSPAEEEYITTGFVLPGNIKEKE